MIVSEFMNNLPDDSAQNYPVPTALAIGRSTNERLEVLLAEIRGLRADLRQAVAESATPPAPKPTRVARKAVNAPRLRRNLVP